MQKGGPVCCFLLLLNKVSKKHSYPFLTESVLEVSGADANLALDAICLCVLLSEALLGEPVMGRPSW